MAAPDQIKYLFYEDLFTPGAIEELTSFIGVRPWPANFEHVVNPGEKLPLTREHAVEAFKTFAHIYDFVFERFGDRVPAKWRETAGQYSWPHSSTCCLLPRGVRATIPRIQMRDWRWMIFHGKQRALTCVTF